VLRDALEKLRNTAPKKLKELRDVVEADLKTLENLPASGANVSANDFFQSFKLGCEAAGLPKLVVIALEAIQKQITYGFLTGRGPDPFKPENGRRLIDAVVDSVCNCAESADDTVQMHMISTLLAAVTSQVCEVHGQSLMLAVDTCMKLYRDSKSQSNQRMAQTALTQMLSVITQRLELSSADMSSRAEEVLGSRSGAASAGAANSEQLAAVVAAAPAAFANANADLAQMPKGQLLNEWMSSYLSAKIDTLAWNHEKENGQKGEDPPPGKFGWCVVCRHTANHYCVDTRDSVCGHACKYRNLERLSLVEKYYGAKREASSPAASPSVSSNAPAVPSQSSRDTFANRDEASSAMADVSSAKSMNVYHQDSIIILTYLINSSAKESVQSQADSRAIRNKRIALELILGVLSNAGPVFRSSKHFVDILKKLVGDSLIKNSVSPIPKIFGLSLQIFVSLITNFKEHLRDEIGVFIEQIFLKILESGNSDFLHKSRVLQIFYKLCTDATTPLELFLNYDCDVDEKNIFERTIDCLSKIAQGKYTAVEHANLIQPHQEQELKQLALQSLVTLMGSIVDWARRMAEDHKMPILGQGSEDAKAKDGPESDGEDDASDVVPSLTTSASQYSQSSGVPTSSFKEQKQRKLDLQIGINKFNMKPKRGIEYLKKNGFLTDDPASLAVLFKNTELGLDKTAIGDYLGEDKPFNKSALFALVDGLDFKAQSLDGSLRHFLSYFRLPGEAQKIDRMMEKFAEKYCSDNPERFANADCAFVLSFSLIMLQTDLHNPGIKNKMTKDEFVKNNRGINDHQDLPREYLEGLYDGVLHSPISLQEDQEARNRQESQAARDSNQKYELFVKETESMVQKTKAAMQMRRKSSAYVVAQSVEHVKPLFEVACWPYLATLAVLLEMEVVSNPILDRTFVAPNGTSFPNPIHDAAWASLKALQADLVRFVPWFPYPKKSVAELDAPTRSKTSWDFTNIMPQLEDFMDAVYGQNHTVVLNFATQPCWLFGDAKNQTQNCSYPSNPDESFVGYVRGDRRNLLDPSGKTMAAYFGRLLSYLVTGEFVDENGIKHTGGPAYTRFNRQNGHVWELFNEAEHGYTAAEYIHDYDVIVPEMIRAVGGWDHAPAFMGLGGVSTDWVPPFLNRSNHSSPVPPIDYISVHHYASCVNRTDPSTYSSGFFGDFAAWMKTFKETALVMRNSSSFPDVKLDLDELGVIMPGDNDPSGGLDADLPDIYWNAAGAAYAYVFATLAPLGVEVLGQSQLAGSPKIPEWGIPLPQYPSVSLLDWRTGLGNARYWVLKLLIEEFAPGDLLVSTDCQSSDDAPGPLSCMGAVAKDGSQKLLIVNHLNGVQTVKLSGFKAGSVALRIVDPKSVQVASSNGIRNSTKDVGQPFSLDAFAVVVASHGPSVSAVFV
ncbi:ARFGEF2, partial [Symbiodinium sp. KB8]